MNAVNSLGFLFIRNNISLFKANCLASNQLELAAISPNIFEPTKFF